jgi:K+-sensing histidine kinase KdpD
MPFIQIVINYDRFNNKLSLEINEQGPGLIKNEVDSICNEFKIVQENKQLLENGKGLAILISQRIVEQYSGSI